MSTKCNLLCSNLQQFHSFGLLALSMTDFFTTTADVQFCPILLSVFTLYILKLFHEVHISLEPSLLLFSDSFDL